MIQPPSPENISDASIQANVLHLCDEKDKYFLLSRVLRNDRTTHDSSHSTHKLAGLCIASSISVNVDSRIQFRRLC